MPDTAALPPAPTTRFAPAPTGYLHLGHVANAIFVWGIARAAGGRVILRMEDHDRQRCRTAFETALLDDLEWLGLEPDVPSIESLRSGAPSPYRQRDRDDVYRAAARRLAAMGRLYACSCSRADFERWAARHGRSWQGPGCPGGCRAGGTVVPEALETPDPNDPADGRARPILRAWIGDGEESFEDVVLGHRVGPVAPQGDPPVRDRHGNWTYGFAVVVDDREHGVDLVIRGRDLLHATPGQIRLATVLGRATPPVFLHHPLIHKPGGAKLSKADGDTGIRDLRAAGRSAADTLAAAADAVGLMVGGEALVAADLPALFVPPRARLPTRPGS